MNENHEIEPLATLSQTPQHVSLTTRIVSLLRAHKGTLAGILASSLVLNLFGLAAPRFTQAILDQVLPQSDFTLLAKLILALVLVTVLQILLTIWRRLTLVHLSLGIDRVVLAEFLGHVLSLPISFFKRHQTGDLVSRWSEHGHVRHLLAGGLTRVIIDALMVIVYFVVMFIYSVQLALVVVGLLVLFGGYMALRSPVMHRQHRRLLDEKGAHEARLIEILTGIDLVKAMAIEDPLRQKWEEELQDYLASNYRTQKLRQILESGGTAIQFLCTGALLWYGAVPGSE
jgi:ABC-type bacteriocin/lantibiotic exporter with double-glycine peptidase domain